jgi:uncharacterized tellurite resistance protein B-like protein
MSTKTRPPRTDNRTKRRSTPMGTRRGETRVSLQLKVERPDGSSTLTIEPPERISSSVRYRNLMRNTATLLIGQALIDGKVETIEMNRIKQLLYKLYRVSEAEIASIMKEAIYSYHELGILAVDNSASMLKKLLSRSQKDAVLHHMIEIADSDGEIDKTEHSLLKHVGSILRSQALGDAS